jgi:hypothetical protein
VDTSDGALILELETRRTLLSPVPDFIYGWLPGNPYSGNGLAAGIGVGNAAFGNTQSVPNRFQRTFAHEIGHLLGLSHNTRILSPEVGFDPGWIPFEVTPTDDCDATGTQGTKCSALKDFMYAGQLTPDAWVDPVTYGFLENRPLLQSSCPGRIFRPFKPIKYLLIPGKIVRPGCEVIDCCPGCPGPFVLEPIWEFTGPVQLTRNLSKGNFSVELRNAAGQVLLGQNFNISYDILDTARGKVRAAPFALYLPVPDEVVASVVLLDNLQGQAVARLKRSPNAPKVNIVTPQPGDTLLDKALIEWEADDADGDPLTFVLQYSPDKGQTFLPLAVNLTRNRFTLDTTQIPGGQEAILRLFASDGLNTTMDEVAGLTVGERKLPTVRIVEPGTKSREAVRLRQGAPLLLVGYGYDPEDGFLPDKALSWSSSLDGRLGTGRNLQATKLSVGLHTISLVGIDSDQNKVRRSILVEVVAQ